MRQQHLTNARFTAKPKAVKFAIRNDCKTSMELKVGEEVVTIQAGKSINVSLPIGAQIIRTQAIESHPAGEVLVTVEDFLGDTTVVVNP